MGSWWSGHNLESAGNENPVIEPVSAKVLSVSLDCVSFKFTHEEEEQVAVMTPSKMFINGSENLLNFARAEVILRQLFPEEETIRIYVKKMTSSILWEVTVLTSGHSSIRDSDLHQLQGLSEPVPEECVVGWQRTAERVCQELFAKAEEEAAAETEEVKILESWFLISMSGLTPSNIPDKYSGCDQRNVRGVVTEVFRPFGGVVDVGPEQGGKIAFHRNVIFKNGSRLGVTKTLEDCLKVGDSVTVKNAEGKVASAVYLDEIVEEVEHPELESYGQPCHKVRIVDLYEGEGSSGMMTFGLGCIQYSHSSSNVGEFVSFAREDLYFHGARLSNKVDLGHILAVGDNISCHLKKLDNKQGRAQFVCKLGWLDSTSRPVARPLLASESPELHRWCATKGLTLASVERILAGEAGLKGDHADSDMTVGHVIELNLAENNKTVAEGLIKIDAGPHKGRVVRFSRTKATLFGMKLDKADLLYIARPFDRAYCELSGINDYPEGKYVCQNVQFHNLMADSEEEVTDPLTELTKEERLEFLFWLDIHRNTWHTTSPGSFKSVLAGNAPTRYFIPFPRDSFTGRVISFDLPKNKTKKSFGCISGTISLDDGYFNLELEEVEEGQIGMKDMQEVKVTFHRSCFWIYGRKMGKVDLSHVVQPNEKVSVECRRITEEDRKKHELPLDIDFQATIIWIGPCRPRHDSEDPNSSCPDLIKWLSRREMNPNQFSQLVEGLGRPANNRALLNDKGFLLAPPPGEGASLSGLGPQAPDSVVHDPIITHILDTAIMSTGPQDPRLITLLENDQMAKAADHVSGALGRALQHYMDRKRAYDYNNYGGGHSRPPKYPRT